MSPPNRPLKKFFRQFNFQRYTYDPHKPPLEEFKRLCQARQWGASKIRKHETAFLHAIGSEQDLRGGLAGPNVIEFFRKYEYQRFTYDLDAPIQSEFQRLVGLRGWGEANLSNVTSRFYKAVALDGGEQSVYNAGPNAIKFFRQYEYQLFTYDPNASSTHPKDPGTQEVDIIVDWLREQECHGYRYRGDSPELEFKELVRVKRREWNQVRREADMDTGNEAWKESDEFDLLRTEFYEVVEKAFNTLLGRFCQITGFTPWQVLVGLYRPGVCSPEQGMILKSVFVNIFDFLDAFQEILRDPPTTDGWELLQLLRPLAIELEFKKNSMLGVYSALTNRVFPLEMAKEDGTLILLLHRIRAFLNGFKGLMKDFEKEAGDELQEAEKEGCAGIRRLLLSREWACLHPLQAKQEAFPF
ncbi:hypothetical protein B9Z19DRAFT_966530 [Tuber borchii]|uniref:Uncharacterized protein n=1 Tax=Tuber borchii TaxID=42251 RepID=A0A2T7A4V8_TUBBO|nr:hypothetical protein B9Z19DRAFT_966530 [Tuber borchii]